MYLTGMFKAIEKGSLEIRIPEIIYNMIFFVKHCKLILYVS